MANGVLIGKFLPPHLGHSQLLRFAYHFAESLFVFIAAEDDDALDGNRRLAWLGRMHPSLDVRVIGEPIHPDHVDRWAEKLVEVVGSVDYLFAVERLGLPLAEVLNCHLVTIDPPLASLEMESEAILANPSAHWDRIPPQVRSEFVKRICIFGPESTGKSTLCQRLAQHFRTVAVPEYSRVYLEKKNAPYEQSDVVPIARGQKALEPSLLPKAGRVLFCDTDMLTLKIWSEWLFDDCDPWILEAVEKERHDLYLLTAADVPWVEDPIRYLPYDRENFERRCEEELRQYERDFVRISGTWEERFEQAVRAVENLLV